MNKLLSYFLGLVFIFVGCAQQPTPQSSTAPSWILNPNQNSKNGAVGSSMRTYDQKTSTQRKLAITRALDELSLQRGVKVDMSLRKQDSYKNGNSITKMDVDSSYKTNNTITAHIEAIHEDKISGELFIWMVMD